MLAELRMELESEGKPISYYQSSNLQGVMMEQIDSDYAGRLHTFSLNPYSQSVVREDDKVIWNVRTLNKEAYDNIIKPLSEDGFKEFDIDKKGIHVSIVNKENSVRDKRDLLNEFYNLPSEKYLNIEIKTPCAFKSDGRYVIMPDLRRVYQSLMNKYSASFSQEIEMFDDDTLDQMILNSEISRYNLRSTFFPIEGVKIPSFIGELGIRLRGTETLARYVRLLFEFGEYSGIGIKSSMGMGAYNLLRRRA